MRKSTSLQKCSSLFVIGFFLITPFLYPADHYYDQTSLDIRESNVPLNDMLAKNPVITVDTDSEQGSRAGSRSTLEDDPSFEEISEGYWESTWNFTNSSSYALDSVVLVNGSAELAKKNDTIDYDGAASFVDGQFSSTSVDYLGRLILKQEREHKFYIADGNNHRVLELDEGKGWRWQYGQNGTSGTSAGMLNGPQSIEIMDQGNLLVSDTINHRVLEINRSNNDNIGWSFGIAGTSGSGPNQLDIPTYASELASGDIIVTDSNNHEVVVIDKKTVNKGWTYGTGSPGSGNNQLNLPASAVELSNGTILIADYGNHRVILVDNSKKVLWQYGDLTPGFGTDQLRNPYFAYPLVSGNVLISDTGNHRVIEVNMTKSIQWQYGTNGLSGVTQDFLELPGRAYPTSSNNVIVADSGNHRVLELTQTKNIVWLYGQNATSGSGPGQLDSPVDISLQELKFFASGSYTSGLIDANSPVYWLSFQANYIKPTDTDMEFFFRVGETTNTADATWSTWDGPLSPPGNFNLNYVGKQYLQFRVDMSTTNANISARLISLSFSYEVFKMFGEIAMSEFSNMSLIRFEQFIPDVVYNNQTVSFFYSIDNGNSWSTVPSNNSLLEVDTANKKIMIKANLTTTDPTSSPVLNKVQIRMTMYGEMASIVITPLFLNISAGDSFTFTANGYDSKGNALDISPAWTTTVGSMIGSNFTARQKVGNGFVNATVGPISAFSIVNVTPAELLKIKVLPKIVNVTASATQVFTATGQDKYNNIIDIDPIWTTTVGLMVDNVLHAQLKEGNGFVWATVGDVEDAAFVNVIFDELHPPPQIQGTIQNQEYPEDSPPWDLELEPHEFDKDDAPEDLNWHVTGEYNDLVTIVGEYSEDDVLTFIPKRNAVGGAKLKLWLEDSTGFTAMQEIELVLTPVNDRPWIQPIPDLNLKKGEDYFFDFEPYISDVDDANSELTLYTFSTNGMNAISLGGFVAKINYPASYEKNQDIITITASDGSEFTEDLFFINLSDNSPPVLDDEMIIPDTTSLWEDGNKTLFSNLNEYFRDPEGGELRFEFISRFINTTLIGDALEISTKQPDWFGVDTLLIRAFDTNSAFKESEMKVIVIPVNDAPVIDEIPEINVHFDFEYEFDISPFISDVDNLTSDLMINILDTDNVRLMERRPHVIIINYSQTESGFEKHVNFTATDGLEDNSGTLVIYVSDNFPPEPVKLLRPVQFLEDNILENHIDLDNYFLDKDGSGLVYGIINSLIHVDIASDHSVSFSAPENWFGEEQVVFTVKDDSGSTYYAPLMVTVIPVNDKPVISQIPSQKGGIGDIWVLDLKPYVSDPDNSYLELNFSMKQTTEYAILHGSSILFNYDQLATEALTVDVSDGAGTGSASFVVEFRSNNPIGSDPKPEDQSGEMISALFYIFLLIIIINAVGLAIYYRKYKGKFKLEDLFLIHANGNLLSHVGGAGRVYADNEILSGMLTAIQDFIRDGFSDGEAASDDWSLDHLKFGERNIFIERGDYMYIAAVFKGEIGWKIHRELSSALKDIDENYSKKLRDWNGSLDGLEKISVTLENSFETLAPKETRQIFERSFEETEMDMEGRIMSDDFGGTPSGAPVGAGATLARLEPVSKRSRPRAKPPSGPDQKISIEQEAVKPKEKLTPMAVPLPEGTPIAPLACKAGAAAPIARPASSFIFYLKAKSPTIPSALSEIEKGRLPYTIPVSSKYKNLERRDV